MYCPEKIREFEENSCVHWSFMEIRRGSMDAFFLETSVEQLRTLQHVTNTCWKFQPIFKCKKYMLATCQTFFRINNVSFSSRMVLLVYGGNRTALSLYGQLNPFHEGIMATPSSQARECLPCSLYPLLARKLTFLPKVWLRTCMNLLDKASDYRFVMAWENACYSRLYRCCASRRLMFQPFTHIWVESEYV